MNTMNDSNTFDPARYAAKLADGIASIQLGLDMADPANREDWWADVLGWINRLLKTHYSNLSANPIPQPQAKPSEILDSIQAAKPKAATIVGAPWKNAPPWKPQASQAELAECFGILREVSYEQSCHDDRLNSMAESIAALEKWADIEYAPVDGKPSNCIHDLIAEGMNLVTTHCMESAAALVTVATAATDKRADAICKQAELLQNLLASTKALLLNVDARLEALENRAPC